MRVMGIAWGVQAPVGIYVVVGVYLGMDAPSSLYPTSTTKLPLTVLYTNCLTTDHLDNMKQVNKKAWQIHT